MTRLTQAIVNLTRLTSLSTRVLADVNVGTAFVQRPPSYTVPAFMAGGVAGYVAGGTTGSRVTRIDKITFPSDSKVTIAGVLSAAKTKGAGFANSAVAGYAVGGNNGASYVNVIDKVTFPADTVTAISTTLSAVNNAPAGFANSGVAGYAVGGYGAGYIMSTDKITFPADTRTTISATLSVTVSAGKATLSIVDT